MFRQTPPEQKEGRPHRKGPAPAMTNRHCLFSPIAPPIPEHASCTQPNSFRQFCTAVQGGVNLPSCAWGAKGSPAWL
jgi:hypothetical protein